MGIGELLTSRCFCLSVSIREGELISSRRVLSGNNDSCKLLSNAKSIQS